ncbi:hypothetical protein [Rhodococcoides kyotonense]|uniref:Uncharacterized protein n=1 Tax=Rhodococcoides kyotonense TaxID=398843 RepID=A0A239MVW0_9NOCA|nr:hypothetical protein [Rhodococcus kyotonensis]SNT46765.1 hypothetical protein SAMN05421642_12357 [Rhodococcus kyotonensis]
MSTDDGATSAVYSANSGDFMRFTVDASNIPVGAIIQPVSVGASVMKVDNVDALTRTQLRVGGTIYESGNSSPTTTGTYQYVTPATFTTNRTVHL